MKKVAVALLYDRIKAPTLVAKGEGGLANQILAEAESAGVPVSQDELLANTLAQLSLNEEIPEALFQSVAIVLAWAIEFRENTLGLDYFSLPNLSYTEDWSWDL